LILNFIFQQHISKEFCPTSDGGVDVVKEILVQDVVGCIMCVVKCEFVTTTWPIFVSTISKLSSKYKVTG